MHAHTTQLEILVGSQSSLLSSSYLPPTVKQTIDIFLPVDFLHGKYTHVARLNFKLGTLSKEDDDGIENVGKKMSLRSFKLDLSIWTSPICQLQATFLELNS